MIAAVEAATEADARRRHPTAHPWRPDWARLAEAVDGRGAGRQDPPVDARSVPITVHGH